MEEKQGTEIKFPLGLNDQLELMSGPGVFTPNTTTSLLIQAVTTGVTGPVDLLDLGCGTGVVGLALHKRGLIKPPVHASDLSESAVFCCRKNFERYALPADVRGGSLFEPWKEDKFDVIVDDISGISQEVADVSPWFQGVPCNTGKDGGDLVVEILRSARGHLNPGGLVFFPVLSLSNVDVILRTAQDCFTKVERLGRQDWPLPVELKPHLPLLRRLSAEGSIKLQERFGMVICYTEVYRAEK